MSKITIDRAVVEQALEAFDIATTPLARDRQEVLRAQAALRAALEQPVEQEPVAWAEEIIEYLHAHYDTEMIKELDSGDALIRLDDAIAAVEEVEQRYTHPQPPRQPLTDLVKDAFFEGFTSVETYNDTRLNSVEEAWAEYKATHGIGGEK